MKNKTNWSKLILNILFILSIIFIFYGIIKHGIYDRYKLKLYPRFTICTIKDIKMRGKGGGGMAAIFIYNVNNKDYKGSAPIAKDIDYHTNFIGKRYLFVFEENHPRNGYIIWERKILDSTLHAPPNGWKKPPSRREEYERMNK